MENKYAKYSDAILCSMANKGSSLAKTELFLRYSKAIYLISKGFKNEYISTEDLVSEANLSFLKAIKSYKKDKASKFSTYMAVCIKNHLIDIMRKVKKTDNVDITELTLRDKNEYVDDNIIYNELFSKVQDTIQNELSKLEKKILKEYLKGFSYAEISNNLKVSVKTISNGLTRVRNKISKNIF